MITTFCMTIKVYDKLKAREDGPGRNIHRRTNLGTIQRRVGDTIHRKTYKQVIGIQNGGIIPRRTGETIHRWVGKTYDMNTGEQFIRRRSRGIIHRRTGKTFHRRMGDNSREHGGSYSKVNGTGT